VFWSKFLIQRHTQPILSSDFATAMGRLDNRQKVQTYKHAGDPKTKHGQTKTLILQNLTLPKNDNDNATEIILQTQLT